LKDDLNGRPRLDSRLSNEQNEEERSEEEEEELNDSGSHVPSVSAGSPTSVTDIPPVVTTSPKQPEIPPAVAEPPVEVIVPEVSVLDTKTEPKAEPQNRASHGFVATGAPSGSDNVGLGGRGPQPVKEAEGAATPSGTGSVKTFANLFKSDLTPSASSGTHEFTSRSPFPTTTTTKPSTGKLEPSPTAVGQLFFKFLIIGVN